MRQLAHEELVSTIRHIKIYGYAIVKSVLDQDEITHFRKLVVDSFNSGKVAQYNGVPTRDVRDKIIYNLQNKDVSFLKLIANDAISGVLKEFLNDKHYKFLPAETPNYILNYFNARSSGDKLDLHIDSHIPSPGDFTWAMQAVFALDPFTETNGATVLVPGSHLSGKYTDRSLPISDMEAIKAQPGDLVFWDSRLWHGTEANTCGSDRWAIVATFTMWWVKQSMDITGSLPNEIYQKLSLEEKRLLGFCSIPPKNEADRINTKQGYDSLKDDVMAYK